MDISSQRQAEYLIRVEGGTVKLICMLYRLGYIESGVAGDVLDRTW